MRERAQRPKTRARRPRDELIDNPAPEAQTASVMADNERAHFGNLAAQWRELCASEDAIAVGFRSARDDDEAVGTQRDLAEVTGQQMTFLPVLEDERVDRVAVGRGS